MNPLQSPAWYQQLLQAGTMEHYQDALWYDHEYKGRRDDVTYYCNVAKENSKDGDLILELGCGTGRLLLPLVRDGHRLVGIDRNRPMLQRCSQKVAKLAACFHSRVQLIQGDFCHIPLAKQKFSLILAPFHAMMHLYDRHKIEQFFAQIKHCLAPGGLLVLDVANPDLHWLCRDPNKRWSKTKLVHPVTKESFRYSTNHTYDPVRQILFIRLYYENLSTQKEDVVQLVQRQFFPAELEALLTYNGFSISRWHGDFKGGGFAADSEEQILHARLMDQGASSLMNRTPLAIDQT